MLDNGKLYLIQNELGISFDSGYHTDVGHVINKLSEQINQVVDKSKVYTVLPLSAGYDSRLLLSLIKNKNNVHCFTYGVSKISYIPRNL